MAESNIDIDKSIQIFRDIVKRKMIYNETNLHFEYYRVAGDTIPFKDLGFDSLKQFIKKYAGDKFYFEKVGNDFEFIAPKRIDPPADELVVAKQMETSEPTTSEDSQKMLIVKHLSKSLSEGSPPRKNICVSHNIRFASPQSTGTSNPFQNIRNDIRISFNVTAQTREVDCQTMETDDTSQAGAYGMDTLSLDDFDLYHVVEFPWNVRYWHLKITNPVSTNEVWARFHDEFEANMRALTLRLKKAVTDDPRHPNVYDTEQIYVVMDKTQCYRTKIIKFEPGCDQCRCFLIDVGTVNWYDANNTYFCPFELKQIKPMAVRLKLFGLIEFKDNRNARKIVVSELSGKSVFARIQTKKHEYQKQKNKSISVILFDRPNHETRINLCLEIMEKIVATFTAPKLSKELTNYVVISHISKAFGIIYCHVLYNLNDLKYVNEMIAHFVADDLHQSFAKADSETDLQATIANNAGKVYLIYSESDENWFRATILQLETDAASAKPDTTLLQYCFVHCFLIDYGKTRCIRLDNVYELNGILEKYPFQAVALSLDGIQMTRSKIERLKQILGTGEKVMVDVRDKYTNDDINKTKTIALVKMTRVPINAEDYGNTDINKLLE